MPSILSWSAFQPWLLCSPLIASAPNQTCSFRCLIGAPRLGNKRLQGVEILSAGGDLVADYEPRRAGDVERLRKLVIFIQGHFDRLVLHIPSQAIHIEPDGSSDLQHYALIHSAAQLIECAMKGNVFALVISRERRLRGDQ